MISLCLRILLLLALLLAAVPVRAGHPMLSEDTGTQGAGNFQFELGYDLSRLDDARSFLFQPQLSYGTSPSLDLIIQPAWLRASDPSGAHTQGLGDTNLDFKWRFFGVAPLSLGVRAGFELPTSQRGLGLPHGRIGSHGILVATIDAAPWAFDLNAGLTHLDMDSSARSNLVHISGAAQFIINEHLVLILDTSADSNPDRAQPNLTAVALVGAIYSVHPGLDLDAGFRGRLNTGAPAQQWLLGITYRGAF